MDELRKKKAGEIAGKSSVQKIIVKLNINDEDFRKILNILDHWLNLKSNPNKNL
jgi:hypothetical protein